MVLQFSNTLDYHGYETCPLVNITCKSYVVAEHQVQIRSQVSHYLIQNHRYCTKTEFLCSTFRGNNN